MKKNSSSGERPSLGKRKTDNFSKFYNKKRNSAVKEAFRQEKKTEKKERKESIERHFEERRKKHKPSITISPRPAPAKPAPRTSAPNANAAKPAPRATLPNAKPDPRAAPTKKKEKNN